jgi:hypothetical protein
MRSNEHGFPKDAASLEKEIDETRADVRATLEALEEKLSPGQVLDHIVALVRRHGGDYAESFVKAAKENPVATLMASMGLAWLVTAARPEGHERTPRMTRHGRSPAAEETTPALGETALALPDRRETRAGRIRSGFDHLIYEQPLVMGAIGVAVGAIVGAALRSTNGWGNGGGAYVEESIEEIEEEAELEAAAREAADEALRSSTTIEPRRTGPAAGTTRDEPPGP